MPFNIPDNWIWARIKSVFVMVETGINPYIGKKPYYSTGSIKNNIFVKEGDYEHDKRPSRANRLAKYGELIDAKMQGTIKTTIIDRELDGALLSTGFYVLRNYFFNLNYIKNIILSQYFQKEKDEKCSGTTQKAITDKNLGLIIIPIPPLNEQKRIVDKINSLEPLLKDYEAIENKLTLLESEFPDKLKKSILEYAIQGKLVNQDPNDEPASVLLDRIKAEKEKLIKEGKIKRDKNESYIYQGDDKNYYEKISKDINRIEVPFDIPDNWVWVRFSNIVNFILGKTPERNNPKYWGNGVYSWLSISDMKDKQVIFSSKEKVSEISFKENFSSLISPIGTLIMSFKLTVGRVSILGINAVHNEAIISIFPYLDSVSNIRDWLFHTLGLMIEYVDKTDAIKGSTLNKGKISKMLVSLPPLNEQKRITNKVISINQILDS